MKKTFRRILYYQSQTIKKRQHKPHNFLIISHTILLCQTGLDCSTDTESTFSDVIFGIEGKGESQVVRPELLIGSTGEEGAWLKGDLEVTLGCLEERLTVDVGRKGEPDKKATVRSLVGDGRWKVCVEGVAEGVEARGIDGAQVCGEGALEVEGHDGGHDARREVVDAAAAVAKAAREELTDDGGARLDPAKANARPKEFAEGAVGDDAVGTECTIDGKNTRGQLHVGREVKDVVDVVANNEDAVGTGKCDELATTLERQRTARWVVKGRNAVDEAAKGTVGRVLVASGHRQMLFKHLGKTLHAETLAIGGDCVDVKVMVAEDALGQEVGRVGSKDGVADSHKHSARPRKSLRGTCRRQ